MQSSDRITAVASGNYARAYWLQYRELPRQLQLTYIIATRYSA